MPLTHRKFSLAELHDAPGAHNAGNILFSCSDADSVMCLASLRGELSSSVGIWLEVGNDYPAALCARDIATLSWLVDLREVVISGDDADAQAEVVRAMLSDEEIEKAMNDVDNGIKNAKECKLNNFIDEETINKMKQHDLEQARTFSKLSSQIFGAESE